MIESIANFFRRNACNEFVAFVIFMLVVTVCLAILSVKQDVKIQNQEENKESDQVQTEEFDAVRHNNDQVMRTTLELNRHIMFK